MTERIDKSKKIGRGGKFELFLPGNLQRQIDSYGYSFSMGRYCVFLSVSVTCAVGCGLLFSLRWYLIILVAIACAISLPSLILAGYKQMYEHKQFLDVSDYMDQMLYSFRLNQKILLALKDTRTLFQEGRMHEVMGEAIQYIERGSFHYELYKEALEIIERAYPAKRLVSIHEYLRTVESNGGACDEGIELLLQDKAVWADNVMLLQEDKKAARLRAVFSLIVTMLLAVIFHMVYRSMPEQYTIVYHPLTQAVTTLYLLLNIAIFCKVNRQIAKSWIVPEDMEEEKLSSYFQMIIHYDEKKEARKSFIFAAAALAIALLTCLFQCFIAAAVAAVAGILLLSQHKIGYRIAFDKVVREINRVFPGWLMEMALLLQGNNVQVSIEKTIEHAPIVLRSELQQLSDQLKRTPDAIEPYLEFLGTFELSAVLSSMKMLYAISESGNGDAQSQIRILVQRNSKMMDKAEKLSNEKSLAGINGIFYLPQMTVSLQTVVNMVVFMLMFLAQMKL
ncbi:MAG: hypothetical protein HFH37_10055 [Lachnospiraceae bacterium]|nr:hypothetical protein [Lachnospiraceae bacterium]